MKHIALIFTTAILMGIAVESVKAQNPVTATASAFATIVLPIAITKDVDLSFGNIAAGALAGTVVLAPDGARTATGVRLPTVPGVVTAARFTVNGTPGANYTITLPVSVSISRVGGTAPAMTIATFIEDAETHVLTTPGGTQTFNVGATLHVLANQPAGTYEGTFNVTVDYQ